jgi:hypothetical protein
VINNENNFLILYNHLRKGNLLIFYSEKFIFLCRFNLTINEETMNMLTTKRKASSKPNDELNNKPKKIKTTDSNKQSILDCRQIPFQGISIQT